MCTGVHGRLAAVQLVHAPKAHRYWAIAPLSADGAPDPVYVPAKAREARGASDSDQATLQPGTCCEGRGIRGDRFGGRSLSDHVGRLRPVRLTQGRVPA